MCGAHGSIPLDSQARRGLPLCLYHEKRMREQAELMGRYTGRKQNGSMQVTCPCIDPLRSWRLDAVSVVTGFVSANPANKTGDSKRETQMVKHLGLSFWSCLSRWNWSTWTGSFPL